MVVNKERHRPGLAGNGGVTGLLGLHFYDLFNFQLLRKLCPQLLKITSLPLRLPFVGRLHQNFLLYECDPRDEIMIHRTDLISSTVTHSHKRHWVAECQ